MDDLEVADVLGKEGHSFHLGRGRDGQVDLAPSWVAAPVGDGRGELTPDPGDLERLAAGVVDPFAS